MKRVLFALLATVVAINPLAASQCVRTDASPRMPQWSVKECPKTCVVTYDTGGLVQAFKSQAYLLRNNKDRRLVIDGPCISACTIAADIARPKVCITPRASFHFHNGYGTIPVIKKVVRVNLMGEYSRDIQTWIKAKGGLPGKDTCDISLLEMGNRDAQRFFPMCGEV